MHTARNTALVAAVLLAAAAPRPAAAQDFSWRGNIARGRTVEIKGVNGDITAVAASGGEVRVTADKSGRRSDPDDVTIHVLEHDGGVTICAVYPTARGREQNKCSPGEGGRMNNRNNDVTVDFSIEVPEGVRFVGRTVNGDIDASDLDSDVEARTVNGSIDVVTSGLASATTVNGSIDVTMGRTDWARDLEFETVNGAITLTIAGDLDTDVTATTVNGSISTDYPLTVRGRFGPKRVTGTVGNGGRDLSLSTVNGDIELRRR